MRKIIILLLLLPCLMQAQIKISELPTYTGSAENAYAPVTIGAATYKVFGKQFADGKLDSIQVISAVYPAPDTIYEWKVGVKKYKGLISKFVDTSRFNRREIYSIRTLPTIGADANYYISSPTDTSLQGRILVLHNANTSAFVYTPTGATLKEATGDTITTIPNNTLSFYLWDGSAYVRFSTGGAPGGAPDPYTAGYGIDPIKLLSKIIELDTASIPKQSITLIRSGDSAFVEVDGVPTSKIYVGGTGGGSADSSSNPGYASKHYSDSTSALIFSAKPWPNEDSVGVIYHKENWADLYDFTAKSTGTASVALSSGKVTITATSVNWNNNIIVNSNRPTTLERWKFTARVKLGTLSGTTTGIGVGGVRSGSSNTAWMGYVNTTTGGSNGLLTLAKDDGTATLTTGAGAALATGDSIELQMERLDSTIYFRVRNITTNSATTTISYTFLSTSTTTLMAQNMNWAFVQFNTAVNTIYYIDISSDSKRNPNLLVLGDSKTQYAYASYWNTRYGKQLGNTYPSVSINAAGNDRITDLLSRIEEISKQNGQQILLSIGSNDVRAGTAFTTIIGNYADLVRRLEVGGAKVYHIVIPEDSTGGGVGLTRFKNWVAATYPDTYIDVWTGMSSSNVLLGTYNNGDGKHINQAGNDYIASTIVASGKLSPITSRFQSVRSSDDQILLQGSNIKLKYRLNPKTNYIPRWSDTENLVPGLLVDDGTKLTTNGTINFYGTANGATFVDRSSTNTNNAFSFYNQSAYLRLFNNYLGTDIMLWDNGANPKMGFGKAPGNLASFMPVTVNIWGTDAMQMPYGTTAQRPTADTGYMRYNITTNAWEATKGLTYYDVQQGLSGSATLDFASTAAQNSADLTITVTGAADGDPVVLGVPNAAVSANSSFTAWVSAANTVTVRFNNYSSGAIDPASGTFTVRVIK